VIASRTKGYIITIMGVIALSPDGLLTRFITADSVTIVFWRTLLFGIVSFAIVLIRHRQHTAKLYALFSWPEYGVMFCYGLGNLMFMYSITHTSVANTLFMVSTTPIWAALIAWLFLKETVQKRTWFAILMVVIGILIIARGSAEGAGNWKGDMVGLFAAGVLAIQFSLIRKMRSREPLPVLAASGIFTAMFLSPFVDPAATSNTDIVYLIIMGAIMLPIANGLMYLGPKYLPAPEVGLMMLLETILGPVWVWLVVSENPGIYSIIGGSIVLTTLVVNTWLGIRQDQGATTTSDTVKQNRDVLLTNENAA
jgi:drug/metabolite transporter (DMT)-like permease